MPDERDNGVVMPAEWSWRLRALVAIAALALLLVVSSVAIDADLTFMTAIHAPLLLFYVFGFGSAVSSFLGALGLVAVTSWAWIYAATAEHADDRAFVPLTHWVLWIVALIGAALLGAAVRSRRAHRNPG